MDWDGIIDKNHEALRRIVAALVAMAGLSAALVRGLKHPPCPAASTAPSSACCAPPRRRRGG